MSVGASPAIRHSQKKENGGVKQSLWLRLEDITRLKFVTDTHLPINSGYFRNDFRHTQAVMQTSQN